MRNENLRGVCEDLGLENVATVISGGNVVFDAGEVEASELEAMLEAAWPRELGFDSTTIVRGRADLSDLVELQPFGSLQHGPTSYLLVTFFKDPILDEGKLPRPSADSGFRVLGSTARELFTVTDTMTAPNVMQWIEAEFGKRVSSRTWLTVARILKRMG